MGCYALYHKLAQHWRRIGEEGDSWEEFCRDVEALPPGTLWRHNEAGDLPGNGEHIDHYSLRLLIEANIGRRGFTFTHYPMRAYPNNRLEVGLANLNGFTINLSADSLHEADKLAGIGPVVVTLPSDAPDRGTYTPEGRKVVVCPAQTESKLTCAKCELCAHPSRKAIIGFRAHGQAAKLVTLRIKERA